MKKIIAIFVALLFASSLVMANENKKVLKVYESPTCGCCGFWVKYMADNGLEVEEIKTNDFMKIKEQYKIGDNFMSCHTAIIDGYAIEGHVPYDEVKKLLESKPKGVIGISVPGMPQGSPGMEQGYEDEIYDVVMMKEDGTGEVIATYKGKMKIK